MNLFCFKVKDTFPLYIGYTHYFFVLLLFTLPRPLDDRLDLLRVPVAAPRDRFNPTGCQRIGDPTQRGHAGVLDLPDDRIRVLGILSGDS